MASVTGAICTAVAVLAMNKPSTDDEQRRQYETWRGGSNQADDRVGSEVDPSVRCKASENGNMPTIRTRLFQLIDR